ncbi:MAG: sensor histidine kinase [Vicinamibacterales bacterium]
MQTPPEPPTRLALTWRAWAVSLGATAVVAAIFAKALQDNLVRQGLAASWTTVLLATVPGWTVWALAAPLLVAISYAWPLGGRGAALALRIAGHLAIGMLWVFASTATSAVLGAAITGRIGAMATGALLPTVTGFSVDLFLYVAIAGLGSLLRYRGEAVESAARAQALELERAALTGELARSELHVLRARLQPHFLFNALNAVSVLARKGDSAGAVSMIAGLGDLLRAAIDGQQRDLIPLSEEVALAGRYLEIQRIRFGDVLTWDVDVTDEASGLGVPCLLLQPVVENAIVHGVERGASGHVRLEARVIGGRLCIVITTRGATLPEGWALEHDAGEGLALTIERLRRRYPARHGLTVQATRDGVETRFVLPAEPVTEPTTTGDVACAS